MPDLSAPTRSASLSSNSEDRRLAVVAVLVGLLIVAASLIRHDGDIAGRTKFGAGDTVAERTAHVEDVLDREVATVDLLGHDGSMFFLQALDPFYLDDDHAQHLDRPVYRAQRMLFPTIAGLGGLLPAEMILWTMGLTNVAALALGTVGAGRLARRFGGSPWLGLAFTLNPGIVFEFDISGAGILAFAAAIWGTLAIEEGRLRSAIVWFAAAVLAREVMLLYLAGVCVYRLWTTRRIPWLLGGVPALTAAAWAGYVRLRLDSHDGVNEVQEFGPPFGGMAESVSNWIDNPIDLGIIAGLVIVMPLLVIRGIQNPNALAWGAMGFIVVAILLTQQVWWRFFDVSRAIAPVMTAYVVTSFSTDSATERRRTRDADASTS